MVLGHVITRMITALLVFLTSGAASAAEVPDYLVEADVRGQVLSLSDADGVCALGLESSPAMIFLDIAAPCGFVRRPGVSSAQVHTYEPVESVLFVAGPRAAEKEYLAGHWAKPQHGCSHVGQTVIVDGNSVELQPAQLVPFGYCHNLGFDEKVFRDATMPR